jgi:hypothetical protein
VNDGSEVRSRSSSFIRVRVGNARWQARTRLNRLIEDFRWRRISRRLSALHPELIVRTRNNNLAQLFRTSPSEVELCTNEIASDVWFMDRFNRGLQALPDELRRPTSPMEDCTTVYSVVRLLQPEVMVETGVHCGALTAFALRAMDRNGKGRLYSIDRPMAHLPPYGEPNGQGCLVPPELRQRWRLLNGDSRTDLALLLQELESIDCFNHDSLHTYEFMTMEYETAWPHVRPGGLLMSHDVLICAAFADFQKRHALEIAHKCDVFLMGVVRKHTV